MKGIVLAGGTGSRLWPITRGVSKQLLPVYNKPLIHYPISTLMLAGIREIALITTEPHQSAFINLLGDGGNYGLDITYLVQNRPNGIGHALGLCENYANGGNVALILGDNIFYGNGLGTYLGNYTNPLGAHIFAYTVRNPSKYGVVEFDSNGRAISLEEKPTAPKSRFAIPGLYFYDNSVFEICKSLKPSLRGELEITDVNIKYLQRNELNVTVLPRGTAWLDTGSFDSLHNASTYIRSVEELQGTKVACLEEISWRMGWIDDSKLLELSSKYVDSNSSNYLKSLLD